MQAAELFRSNTPVLVVAGLAPAPLPPADFPQCLDNFLHTLTPANSSSQSSCAPRPPRREWRSSPGSPIWLRPHQVRLATTTCQTGRLFLVGQPPDSRPALIEGSFKKHLGKWRNGQPLWMTSLAPLRWFDLCRSQDRLPSEQRRSFGSPDGSIPIGFQRTLTGRQSRLPRIRQSLRAWEASGQRIWMSLICPVRTHGWRVSRESLAAPGSDTPNCQECWPGLNTRPESQAI